MKTKHKLGDLIYYKWDTDVDYGLIVDIDAELITVLWFYTICGNANIEQFSLSFENYLKRSIV